ncbi:MAG: CRTAC1 family protein [Capsulimonadales bacterium]|nr:CRTAC1 family protein [Capsulimonadales bacterium]
MNRHWRLCLSLLLAGSVWSCRPTGPTAVPSPGNPPLFSDVAKKAGVTFYHSTGATGKFYYVEETGAGCAFIDFDRDGWQDIFLVQSGTIPRTGTPQPKDHCALFRNNRDGTFSEVTAGSGLDRDFGYGQGVSVGDYDNDGFDDLYVTAYGGNHLLRNEGGTGRFTDVTERAGVGDTDDGPRYATSSAFGDYDRDGDLDLYVCHYARWTPERNIICKSAKGADEYCTPDVLDTDTHRLYRNNGNGTFTDVSKPSGIAKLKGHGLGVVWLDYDGDGWEDLFVTNDLNIQFLWRNNGNGTFTNKSEEAGTAYDYDAHHLAGMGIGVGDYDNSGRESLFVTNFHQQPNTLFRNLGNGLFEDVSMAANVALPHMKFLAFGCDFFDYDADGWRDLIVANGHVVLSVAETSEGVTYKERKQLFRNDGTGRFVEITDNLGDLGTETVSRGLATGDFDNDGRIDFLVSNQNGPAQLFRNDAPLRGHWISFRTIGTRSNRNGYHAKITVTCGDRKYFSEVHSSSSYASHSDHRVYFGLGDAKIVDSVEIRWPSGITDRLKNLSVDTFYTVTEGKGAEKSRL